MTCQEHGDHGYTEPTTYDDTIKLINSDEVQAALIRMARSSRTGVWADVQREMNRAIDKHGFERTPFDPRNDPRDSFITLSEEVGEVAQTFTYDKQDPNTLAERDAELIQVAAMAMAMVIAGRIGRAER